MSTAGAHTEGSSTWRPRRLRGGEVGDGVTRGSSAMLLALVCMAVGGFLFNAIAARNVTRDALGIHASLVFWLLLLNQLTSMGLPVVVSRLGRFSSRAVQLWVFRRALLVTVASSLVGAVLFAAFGVGTLRSPVRAVLSEHGWFVPLVVVFTVVAGLSLTLLAEIRLVAIGLGRWVVWRAIAANVLRVLLLSWSAVREDPLWLVAVNLGPNALLGAMAAVLLVLRRRTALPPPPADVRLEARVAGVNWVTIAAVQAPQFAVPVIAGLNADSNASFYLAWQVMTVVFLVPVVVGHVVVVESTGRSADALRRAMFTGIVVAAVVTAIAAMLSVPAGRLATSWLFGDEYSSAGSLLPPLVAAAVPWSVTAVILAGTRALARQRANVLVAACFASATMAIPLLIGPDDGLAAARWWLVANSVAALASVAVVLVLRLLSDVGTRSTGHA